MNKKEMEKRGLRRATDQQNVLGPEFKKLYVNNVLLGASNWDMNLTFGEIIGLNDQGTPVVEQKVKLNMSKEFMKALSNLLSVNIASYEKTFGEIRFINIEHMSSIELDIGDAVHKPIKKTTAKSRAATSQRRRS